MAWYEQAPSGNFFVCFRVGDQRFRRSLKTNDQDDAAAAVERIDENLRLVERGRLVIPSAADPVTFLLSDGRVNGPPAVQEKLTIKRLFSAFFDAIPEGSLEASTIYGMKLHRKQLENHFGHTFPIRTLTREQLQDFIGVRAKQVSPVTIRKPIVTLRTVWNWGKGTLLEGPFPSQGLKYPKSREKPPFMSFAEVEERTKGMNEDEATEWWEAVYLTVEDIEALLKHVKKCQTPFVYPMIFFAAQTGARRSEILRARIADVDLKNGWVTIHERKKAHDRKTTRRVPISATLQVVLKKWLEQHPGGESLFCHDRHVARSKKRSKTTGHRWNGRPTRIQARLATVTERQIPALTALTRNEIHDHFRRAVAGSKWERLRGLHALRHSFISCLASKGVDQRIIDEFSGHMSDLQRVRYRHLFPSVTRQAIASVFG